LAAPDLSSSVTGGPPPDDAAAPVRDAELDALFAPLAPFPIIILAVSGGADSVALMHLVSRLVQGAAQPPRLVVATVDHGLRQASRAEAEWVAEQAHTLGLEHAILTWTGSKPATGIQDAARAARYRLLAELARNLSTMVPVAIVTAHTEDDQAETLLMRLARGSGLDGLTAMSEQRVLEEGVVLVRPLLGVSGARLRATLADLQKTWIDDPSNAAERFERVRFRKGYELLAGLGLANDKIALSARRLERARNALDAGARALAQSALVDFHAGAFATFDHAVWLGAPEELRLRLLSRLVTSYGGHTQPVRLAQLEALAYRLAQPGFEGATLAGAAVALHGADVRVLREAGRTALPTLALQAGASAVWDGRFRVRAASEAGADIDVRPLGSPAFARLRQQLTMPRDLPARAAATLPAFWRGEELIIVPTLAALGAVSPAWGMSQRLYSAEFLD
jgi:tRNA(Ile)-lysidine synthase